MCLSPIYTFYFNIILFKNRKTTQTNISHLKYFLLFWKGKRIFLFSKLHFGLFTQISGKQLLL